MSIEEVPRMKLAPQGIGRGMVYVSDAVREMMDAWMLEFFGVAEGLLDRDGVVTATCRSCDRDYEIGCDPIDFYQDMSYCNGSQYCTP